MATNLALEKQVLLFALLFILVPVCLTFLVMRYAVTDKDMDGY
jgi:hypothetical protein